MIKFETVNELYLKVTNDNTNDHIVTKWGAFIGGNSYGERNYKFEKLLLGPQQNLVQAAIGSATRHLTGENVPLTKVSLMGESQTFYSSQGQHVICYQLQPGETINIESENLLAFTSSCDYKVRFLGVGVLSQRGFMTSTLTGTDGNSLVAFLSDGNPLMLSNAQMGNTVSCDPDAVIAWIGQGSCDPEVKLDVNWKTAIAQTSGESYMFEWNIAKKCHIILQPTERTSGIDINVDGNGGKAQLNQQQTITSQLGNMQDTINNAGQILNNLGQITQNLHL